MSFFAVWGLSVLDVCKNAASFVTYHDRNGIMFVTRLTRYIYGAMLLLLARYVTNEVNVMSESNKSKFVVCAYCGKVTVRLSAREKYCSDACRMAAYRRRKNPAIDTREYEAAIRQKQMSSKRCQRHEGLCMTCGAAIAFDGTRTATQYCSPACKQKMYRERKKLAGL